MANRAFHNNTLTMEPAPVKLSAVITIGATGAPTLTRGKGISSVTRNSAGDYTLAFKDPYQKLLGFAAHTLSSTGLPTAPFINLKADNSTSGSSPGVEFVCGAATSSSVTTLAATDPANGDVIYLEITLSNSGAL